MQKTATSEISSLHYCKLWCMFPLHPRKKAELALVSESAALVSESATLVPQFWLQCVLLNDSENRKCWNLLCEGLELDSVLTFENSSLRANYAINLEAVWLNIAHLMLKYFS